MLDAPQRLFRHHPHPVLRSICNLYEQLGARGSTVLFSSGDGGVSGNQQNEACDGKPFRPVFPGTCP